MEGVRMYYYIGYASISLVLFIVCLCIRRSKIDFPGMGIKLGVVNSLLVALFWPIFLVGLLVGAMHQLLIYLKGL